VRRRRHLELIKSEPLAAEAPSPDQELEARERLERVQAALAGLSERDREVLLLWDAGLDYGEIAAQTGLARGAIGTTLARARKRLVEAHDALEGNDAALG
jgi:RNA polymerase sigma-70 factor (ECF subfamily)